MKKTILEKGLVVYSFDPIYENEFVSYNVMTLHKDNEGFLQYEIYKD